MKAKNNLYTRRSLRRRQFLYKAASLNMAVEDKDMKTLDIP